MSLLSKILGDPTARYLKKLQPIVDQINKLESEFEKLSDQQLKEKTLEFKKRLSQGETLDNILPDAFAAVREAAKRTLGQRHYDVQLIAGIVLHRGQIAEQKTGEGKTLSATLPLYLNALAGKGCHLVTVNDYLSKRDTVWMGQIYHALGLSVGCLQHESAFLYDPNYQIANNNQQSTVNGLDETRDRIGGFKVISEYLRPVSRQEAYAADITYGTNNEFGFDYLRDNMIQLEKQIVQQPLHYAIVDEVDSILIDEARTPLIISAPDMRPSEQYYRFAQLVERLKENQDYNIDEKMKAATLTETGISKMEKWLGLENIYTEGGISMVHHIEQALKAKTLFKKERDYVIKDGEVIIVDEFTGRLMFGRRYSEGLHQAIEAKEGVEVKQESLTLATITFQNYFRLYQKLAGMTGTAATEAEEFSKIYNLEVTVIPTNKPMVRNDLPDRVYKSEGGKFKAIVKEVKRLNEIGQPVLIGTISIEKNEILAETLEREGVNCQILNAKNHEREAQIIAQAGKLGAVTVATNMAGRGVDIVLGGNPPDSKEAEKVKELGGLFVLGSERHEARRIDNQLRGRSGRQGDLGASQFYVSLDDDLMRIFGSERMKKLMTTLKVPEDLPIENKMVSRSIESAQKKVEGHNFDIRKHLVEYDDVINKHREVIYKKRREILASKDNKELKNKILEMIENEIEQVVSFHTSSDDEKSWNLEEIYEVVNTIFPVIKEARIKIDDIRDQAGDKLKDAESRTKIINYLYKLAVENYNILEKEINQGLGSEQAIRQIEKGIMLRTIDTLWIEHLEAINYLRTGIGLRGYGQRDPLVEYKKEAYRLFTELMNLIQKQVVYSIYKIGLAQRIAPSVMETSNISFSAPDKTMTEGQRQFVASDTFQAQEASRRESQDPIQDHTHFAGQKVGRNDPCPCGSGRKFKKCHGR